MSLLSRLFRSAPPTRQEELKFEYILVAASDAKGRGYHVQRTSDQKVFSLWRGLPNGMATFLIAGISHYRDEEPFVSPGIPLRLVREPENKFGSHAVAVKDKSGLMIGYVPHTKSEQVGINILADRYQACICVWVKQWGGTITEVRALLVENDVSLGVPSTTLKLIEEINKSALG